jgi:hypothetical protein
MSVPGLIVFIALFLAAIGATLYVVMIRRGVDNDRRGSDEL